MSKFLEYIYPLGGGSIGAIIANISVGKILEVIIFAAIGALVGWIVKRILDYCRVKLVSCFSKKKINKTE